MAAAVTLAAGSAARALAAGLGTAAALKPVAVLGQQTAQAAWQAGFTRIWQASRPDLDALVEAVRLCLEETK
ncbi:uroporphyrinogen-III synthase [Deinococcus lacus]|uniref:Uroporphyrinogen-III synthase n=1 Tax=Deinococcus lacus TaxID=392561 RepID=A0ABW1YDQ9_9DEIO